MPRRPSRLTALTAEKLGLDIQLRRQALDEGAGRLVDLEKFLRVLEPLIDAAKQRILASSLLAGEKEQIMNDIASLFFRAAELAEKGRNGHQGNGAGRPFGSISPGGRST